VAALGASEGSIYGRFGYGPATREIDWTCPRGILPFLDGSLELVDRDTALRVLPAIHETARRHHVGDVRAYPGRFVDLVPADAYVVVAGEGDGYAVYRLERPDLYSSHCTLIVEHLIAATDSAYRSLWSYLVNLDLIEHVVARGRPESEVLPLLLDDHRKVTVTAATDHLWIRLVDLPAALSARGYGYAGSLVLKVTDDACPWNTGRWRLDSGLDGATCRRATSFEPTDLTMDVAALGSLYLGGVAPGPLAAAGRLTGTPQALLRAAALFATPTPPWCSIGF
jgi:predicted acetyltransferase